jgi:hypothetical protein
MEFFYEDTMRRWRTTINESRLGLIRFNGQFR